MNDETETESGVGEAAFSEGMVTPTESLRDVIEAFQKKNPGKAHSFFVYIHPKMGQSNKVVAAVAQYAWDEWNEVTVANKLAPGHYFLTIRAVGNRGFLCTIPFVVGDASRSVAATTPTTPNQPSYNPPIFPQPGQQWPGYPPPGPYGYPYPPSANTNPAPAQAGMSDSVITALIGGLTTVMGSVMAQKGPTLTDLIPLMKQHTPIGELLQLLDVIKGKGNEDITEKADIVDRLMPIAGPFLEKLMARMQAAPGKPATPNVAVPKVIPVAKVAAPAMIAGTSVPPEAEPPASLPFLAQPTVEPTPPTNPIVKIRESIETLILFAASMNGNPATYADALGDVLDHTDIDVDALLALPLGSMADLLIGAMPTLGPVREYVVKLEQAYRDSVIEDDEPETVTAKE